MADFDEYAYLEGRVGPGGENGAHESRHRGDRDRRDRHGDRRTSSHRRSRSRSPGRQRHKAGPRESFPPRPPPRRERTPPEVKEQRDRERELMELDRDIRTVFAFNLSLKADERDIFELFSKAGQVLDVRIIMDRNTKKSKGFAYIEYAQREDIFNALGLTGQLLLGQAVMVKSSEAEKNLAWEAAQQQSQALQQMNAMAAGAGSGPCKLFVGNLHPNIAEADLKQIFEPFGTVEYCTLQRDQTGRSQGIGFVQFSNMPDATKAMQQIDGLEIANQKISVKIAAMSAAETAAAAMASQVDLDGAEDEYGGLRLSSNARASLMSRLAGGSAPPSTATPPGQPMPGMLPGGHLPPPPAQLAPPQAPAVQLGAAAQALTQERGLLGPASPVPSSCLLLKNMFNPTEETEPEWDNEIGEDVKGECSKFGTVTHHYVDRNSQGFVYLKFGSQEMSAAAQKALHGRWFAGRQVVAEFQIEGLYRSHFRC